MQRTVSPDWIAAPRINVPPIQKKGNAQKILVSSSPTTRAAPNQYVPRSTVACVCTTPFGSALEPDVYVTCARSAATTSASMAASSSSSIAGSTSGSASSSIGVAHARSVPPVIQTERNEGTSGR